MSVPNSPNSQQGRLPPARAISFRAFSLGRNIARHLLSQPAHARFAQDAKTQRNQECNKAILIARYPIVKSIKTHCSATAVCAELKGTPIGPCLIYGTIIPYCGAGSRYHYQYAGKNRVGEKGWNLHYESIALHQKDLLRLKQQFPKHRIFFAGDFNQSRDGRTWWNSARQWYGTQQGRNQLTECLDASGLRCVTEVDFVKMGKITTMSTVDHICVDDRVASKISAVGGWDAPLIDGKRSSDHCGVWVTLASAQA